MGEDSQIIVHYDSYGPLLTAGAIVFSTFSAMILALLSIQNARRIAKAQLAFTTFSRTIWDEDFIKARKAFTKLLEEGGNDLAKWASNDKDASEEVTVIKSVLNDYETIANGISVGIIDEKYYFNLMRGAIIRDYNASRSYIEAKRNRGQNTQLFKQFEALAKRWMKIQPGEFPELSFLNRLWDRH